MTLRERIDKLGGRKFALTAFIVASGTVMRFTGHIDQTGWVAVVTLALGVYGTANVTQKATSKEVGDGSR